MKKFAIIAAATAAVAFASAANAAAPRSFTEYPSAAFNGAVGQVSLSTATNNGGDHSSGFDPIVGPVFNSNGFEAPGYTVGSLIGQNSWIQFNATGGSATYTVGAANGVGGTHGVTANGIGTTFAFPDQPVIPIAAGEGVSVNIDIARTVQATAATSTANYNVDVYSAAARVTRFGLVRSNATSVAVFVTAPFNTATSQFQAGSPLFNVTITGALSAASFYNLESRLNYSNQTMAIYSNNALVFGGIPFATAAAGGAGTQTTFSDADLSIGAGQAADNGFFDNYNVQIIAVPEPMSLSALALGGMLLGRRRRD